MNIKKKGKEITAITTISLKPSQYQKLYDLAYPESISKYIRDWIDSLKIPKKGKQTAKLHALKMGQ